MAGKSSQDDIDQLLASKNVLVLGKKTPEHDPKLSDEDNRPINKSTELLSEENAPDDLNFDIDTEAIIDKVPSIPIIKMKETITLPEDQNLVSSEALEKAAEK